MPRAPFQVLVFPYRRRAGGVTEYAIFRRADLAVWQVVSGGGEDDESPADAAAREAFEEAAITPSRPLDPLMSTGAIAVEHFADRRSWDPGLRTIPEYSFGLDVGDQTIELSAEHSTIRWVGFTEAIEYLEWESNRVALRELNERLTAPASRACVQAG
jgi:dATP pyrophosphohydrolase